MYLTEIEKFTKQKWKIVSNNTSSKVNIPLSKYDRNNKYLI